VKEEDRRAEGEKRQPRKTVGQKVEEEKQNAVKGRKVEEN
jgi:hypothetical protein